MEKLTRQTPPENLIRYVSHAGRYDLEQKLGTIEHQSEHLIAQSCDRICRFRMELNQEDLDKVCSRCPINELAELIGI